jgi:RNA polymerase sigma-70 factor (ECF subfamily)
VIYCIVPRELAPKLHDTLRRCFREDPEVEVVVERRDLERRGADRRRAKGEPPAAGERRLVRAESGRRVADRRAATAPVPTPELPRKARAHAAELLFVERVARTSEQEEDIDTARLVTRIQAGHREGFADLYLRYFDRVYGYARMVLRDQHEAEDLTQQVFMRVLEALPRYERRKQPFRGWLFVIVRNHMLHHLRKYNRLDVVEPQALDRARERSGEGAELDLSVLGWITDRDLMLFIERLSVPQRQVLLLRYMLDLPAAEIAEILGKTPEQVRKLQQRALDFLEARLSALGRTPRSGRARTPSMRRRRLNGVIRERRFALL